MRKVVDFYKQEAPELYNAMIGERDKVSRTAVETPFCTVIWRRNVDLIAVSYRCFGSRVRHPACCVYPTCRVSRVSEALLAVLDRCLPAYCHVWSLGCHIAAQPERLPTLDGVRQGQGTWAFSQFFGFSSTFLVATCLLLLLQVMAANLMTLEGKQTTVAVVGLAHVDGIERILAANGWKPQPC